jgi:branched-chain amino acid transport system ATP-binding protein
MMDQVAVKIDNVSLSFGGLQALKAVSGDVKEGELLGLIGPNGSGKTCLLNCISGFYRPQRGRILWQGYDLTKLPPHKIAKLGGARTFQHIELFSNFDVVDNLMAARHVFFKSGVLAGAVYFGRAQREEIQHRWVVEQIIDFLELGETRGKPASELPYGLQKRVDLGRALALEPKLLMLDEPMAGMNLEEKEDMVRFVLDIHEGKWTTIMKQKPTIILVEHDMSVVMDIVDRIVVLDWGEVISEGTPDKVGHDPKVIKAYLGVAA